MRLIKWLLDWLAYIATAREEKPAARPEPVKPKPAQPTLERPKWIPFDEAKALRNGAKKSDPEYLKRAFADLGEREVPGPGINPRFKTYFDRVGHEEIDDDVTPFCAAGAGCWLVEAGLPSTGSLMAISYEKYGKPVSIQDAKRGDIVVWKRGNIAWQRHVNFLVHRDESGWHCIGANQSDSVNVARFTGVPTAVRRPPTVGTSRTIKAAGLSLLTLGPLALAEPVSNAASAFGGVDWLGGFPLAVEWLGRVPWILDAAPYMKPVAGALGLVALVYTILRKRADIQESGQ